MSQQVTVTFENVDAFRAAFENSYNSAQAEQLFHCQKELAEANERIFILEGRLENKNCEQTLSLDKFESAIRENEKAFDKKEFIPIIKFVRSFTGMTLQEGKDFVEKTFSCFERSA